VLEKEGTEMKAVCRYGVFWGLFMIFVLSPCSSDAGFLVELHNGRKLRVEGYQMQGKNCELYLESGSFRVSKDEIKSIQEKKDDTGRPPKEEIQKDEPKAAGSPGEQNISKKPETSKSLVEQKVSKNSVPRGAEVESYIQKKAELRERLEEAKKVYFAATEKTEKDWARQKMISFSRELFTLEAEVKEKHNGSLPDWWKQN
jgi:hypothetical protein